MKSYWLCFKLLSDATFGRGEGVAGLVDQEIEHDDYGLPFLRGRTLKGLLNEECAGILYALEQQGIDRTRWNQSAQRLFGGPGSGLEDDALLRVGPARLPADLRRSIRAAVDAPNSRLTPTDILESLTTIRAQTAVDEETGVPAEGSLRAMRVVVRQAPFEALLTFVHDDPEGDLPLLAACILALRRAGTGRNRGRGRLQAGLHVDDNGRSGADITREQFDRFAREVQS